MARNGLWAQLAALGVVAAVATTAYAYASSTTVDGGRGGEGAAAVSGYTVSLVEHELDPGDPARIAAVTFALTPATPSRVDVQLAPGGAWYPCHTDGGSVRCEIDSPSATVAAATELRVVATA